MAEHDPADWLLTNRVRLFSEEDAEFYADHSRAELRASLLAALISDALGQAISELEDDRRILDRSLRIIDEQLERELGNIPARLTDEDVETIRGLLYRQIRPYAATFLGVAATAKTVVHECGGHIDGLPRFVDQAMGWVFELSGSIEVPDSICDSGEKEDELSDAIYEIREKVSTLGRIGARVRWFCSRRQTIPCSRARKHFQGSCVSHNDA